MSFECPLNAEIYFDQVASRCRGYIHRGLWTIEPTALDGWISNFKSTEEKHLAACLLDRVIFRSEAQVSAMIQQLLQRTLSDALAAPNQFGLDWQAKLSDEAIDPGVRIVPVIRDSDSPAKSGPLVARLFRQLGRVSDQWMIWPWLINKQVKGGAKTMLFIDDFAGSGQQFKKFVKRFHLASIKDAKLIYMPLIAHPHGVDAIERACPSVRVVPGEVLAKASGVFEGAGSLFDRHNSISDAKKLYASYWKRQGIKLSKDILFGWDKLNLALAFQHGTPNASLPLFWLNRTPHKALFRR